MVVKRADALWSKGSMPVLQRGARPSYSIIYSCMCVCMNISFVMHVYQCLYHTLVRLIMMHHNGIHIHTY